MGAKMWTRSEDITFTAETGPGELSPLSPSTWQFPQLHGPATFSFCSSLSRWRKPAYSTAAIRPWRRTSERYALPNRCRGYPRLYRPRHLPHALFHRFLTHVQSATRPVFPKAQSTVFPAQRRRSAASYSLIIAAISALSA